MHLFLQFLLLDKKFHAFYDTILRIFFGLICKQEVKSTPVNNNKEV